MPSASGTYVASDPSVHREVILGAEFRCVGRVLGRSNRMWDSPAVTPVAEVVAHSRVPVLRRSGRYRMSRTWHPGKCLSGAVISAVHIEGKTGRSGSHRDSFCRAKLGDKGIIVAAGDGEGANGRTQIKATNSVRTPRLLKKINVRFVAHSRPLHCLAQIVRSGKRFRLVEILHWKE